MINKMKHMFHPEQEFQIFYLSGAITPLDGVFLMYKIPNKNRNIVIILAILLVLFGIFRVFIHPTLKGTPQEGNQSQNTENKEILQIKQNSADSKIFLGPRVGSPDHKNISESASFTENIQTDSVNLIAGDKNINLQITQGQTLYEILQNEENKKLILFDGKEYTGIGFFVTSIGNLHQENGKYLMYYVNGIEASLGISQYVPKSGDLIEWKLK